MRAKLGASWGIGETGATGPSPNRFGDVGRSAVAIVGPREMSRVIDTKSDDRVANMRAFAEAALDLLVEALEAK